MIHYIVDQTTLPDIYTAYPHDPADHAQSFADYLEAKRDEGLELVACQNFSGGSSWFHVFRVAGRDE
jgi:hypothetical protein